MAKVVREKEMKVPLSCIWDVITDFEEYPEFAEEVVGATVQPGGTATHKVVEFELEIIKRFRYLLEFDLAPQTEVRWKLKESNFFKQNDGRWALKALGPERTRVTYELEVSFGFLVPGWVTRKLTEINLPRMLETFEARALKRQGR